jgi:alanine racemase
MQRLGFDAGDIPLVKKFLSDHPDLEVAGVFTHLTHGEDAREANGPTSQQLKKFNELIQGFPGVRHAHKSATLSVLKDAKIKDGIGARPGISIYGLPHFEGEVGEGLRPVLNWKTAIVALHDVEKGGTVSYSSTWKASRPSRIAALPVGYGDGYSRALSNQGQMLVRGQRVPVVGRVCMDYTMVDVTDLEKEGRIKIGEEVMVIGRQGNEEITAYELAEKIGTISYEVVTGISARVRRE